MLPKHFRVSNDGMRCRLCVQSSLHPVLRGPRSVTSPEMMSRRTPHIASDTTGVSMRFARTAGRVRVTYVGSTSRIADFSAASTVLLEQLDESGKSPKPHDAHNLLCNSIRAVFEEIHAEGRWIHPRGRPKFTIRIRQGDITVWFWATD